MEPERRCKSGMDGGLRAAVLFSPPLHLRMDDFLSNRWGPPQVSITQPLNTTGSMGRLTLNILLSFAEFERQIIADRTRDKMARCKPRLGPVHEYNPPGDAVVLVLAPWYLRLL